MSRIQNILEKAEREGTALRTGHFGAPAAPGPVTASVPISIDIPPPPLTAPPAGRSLVPRLDIDGSAGCERIRVCDAARQRRGREPRRAVEPAARRRAFPEIGSRRTVPRNFARVSRTRRARTTLRTRARHQPAERRGQVR